MKNKILNTVLVWVMVNAMILPFPFFFGLLIFEGIEAFIEALNSIEFGVKNVLVFCAVLYEIFILYLSSKF
tara:strand:+ start:285 stop:497 length:213 start_codon:yes stop_codon:yes gene_type:complete